ncbi:hypothetical protein H8E07_16060 [bacterium]|nr:hypothetical protein [bacterium]
MKRRVNVILLTLLVLAISGVATAQVNVTVDPATMTFGYMHVSDLPENGGAYQFGGPWGPADLTAVFDMTQLTLGPNTIGDPNEYWYQCIGLPGQVPPDNCGMPGAPGNKSMEANFYAEVNNGSLNGQTLTFSGKVDSNTLTAAHTAQAWIKVFDGAWNVMVDDYVDLPVGSFSATLDVPGDAVVVQWGTVMTGVNVWVTDTAPFGTVILSPELVANEDSDWGSIKSMYR